MKKLAMWAGIALVVFFIFSNPNGAAGTAKSILSGLADLGTAAGAFVSALLGGGR